MLILKKKLYDALDDWNKAQGPRSEWQDWNCLLSDDLEKLKKRVDNLSVDTSAPHDDYISVAVPTASLDCDEVVA